MGDDRQQDAPGFLMGQLTAQIAGLNARLDQLNPTLDKLDERLDANDRRVDRIESDVGYMKPHVKSWSACKNRLAGAFVVLSGASAAAAFALNWIGSFAINKIIGDN